MFHPKGAHVLIPDILFYHRTDNTVYHGRNGTGKCLGLAIDVDQSRVTITPLNSKGLANCSIDIPANDLLKVVEGLRLARTLLHRKLLHRCRITKCRAPRNSR